MAMLTQKRLKELLHYNPDTGVFTWRVNRRGTAKAGSVAGSVHVSRSGYKRITIKLFGKRYFLHRLAWLYMTGEWPKDQTDHEDGDGLNNRWKNLRDVTNKVNCKNQKRRSNNKSGATGVHWDNRDKKWKSQIQANDKRIYLGMYDDYDEAVLIRKQAEEYYGFHENHDRDCHNGE